MCPLFNIYKKNIFFIQSFKDEIFGLGYNLMPDALWEEFTRVRPPGQHPRPSLVHWEYGKEDDVDDDGNKIKGHPNAIT